MDFTLTQDRRMLADTLGRYLAERYGIAARNAAAYGEAGYSPEHWRALNELGIGAALFDETAGGFGGAGFDIMLVFEAIGRALVVEPFLGALMAGRALAAGGTAKPGIQAAALARIVSGEAIAAFAHEEAGQAADAVDVALRAERRGGGWRLDGAKAVVRHAPAADLLVVSARTAGVAGERDGLALFLVPASAAGLGVRGYATIDGGRAGEVTFDGVMLGEEALIGEAGAACAPIEAVIGAGLLALSAEALGAMEAARTATLDYLRTRVQFGVPIGRFQALQHRMATLLLEIEQTRSAVINAAAALDGPAPAAARALSAAKVTAGRTGLLVAEEAVQMHGGIGMTWELPLSHHAKRLTMIDHQLGDEDHHLQRFIALGRIGAA